jgi:hypothetical protein
MGFTIFIKIPTSDMPATELSLTKLKTTKRKVNRLLLLKKITLKDIESLSQPERDYLGQTATKTVEQLKGAEREDFLNKIELILHASTKNQLWEYNHQAITEAISKLIRQLGAMPPKNAIAEVTGLSRQTIAKHLKEYKTQPECVAEMEQFKFMTTKLLASVFKFASSGDMRAARLYFEMVGAINKQPANTVVNRQNNYIQINNTILRQENLQQLSAEQLNQIENIITARKGK